MSIVRIYVRTFQNEEHADLFILLCQKLKKMCNYQFSIVSNYKYTFCKNRILYEVLQIKN